MGWTGQIFANTPRRDSLAEAHACGGAPLQSTHVDGSWFAADAMLAGGEVAFEDMTHPQLKDELAARGEARSGLKHVLQRRLHALLKQAAIDARREDDEEGGGEGEAEGEGVGWGPNKHCGQLSPRLNRTLTSRLEIEALPLFVVDNQAITNFTSVRIPPNSFHYQDQRTRMLNIFNVI